MVVGHLGVVDEPPPQGALPRAGCKMLQVRPFDVLDDPRQGPRHLLREVSAVRARITDELVALIQRLREV